MIAESAEVGTVPDWPVATFVQSLPVLQVALPELRFQEYVGMLGSPYAAQLRGGQPGPNVAGALACFLSRID